MKKPTAVLLALVILVAAFAQVLQPRPSSQTIRMADGVTNGDLVLYRAIDEAVRGGENYYSAATRLQRASDYPLRPFLTVRPPTLSWLYAAIGPVGMLALGIGLICLNAAIWYRNVYALGLTTRLAAIGVITAFGAAGLDTRIICSHEWWCGLLLGAALGLDREKYFIAATAFAAAATMIREFAVLFLALLLVSSAIRHEWHRVAAVTATLAGLALLLVLHGNAVAHMVQPSDIASPGWAGLRGIYGFADDLALLLGLDRIWRPLAVFLTLAPLAGWIDQAATRDWFAFAWVGGFAALVAIAARADNFYWAQVLLPVYLVGWVLLLSALRNWRQSAARLRR